LYGKGYTEEDRRTYEATVSQNIIYSMQQLINASARFGGQPLGSPDASAAVKELTQDDVVDGKNVHYFKTLWEDPAIQRTYANRTKFHLNDGAAYFFNKLDTVVTPGYVPSFEDILRARVRTLGIVELAFEVDGNKFRMFDVGGQRNERKKWIHCFEHVTAVLFLGVLSEYDLMLFEDNNVNRMMESLMLFEDICNSPWFKDTSMILFLNKRDLFEDKIKVVPLTVCPAFAQYTGPQTYEAGVEAIQHVYEARNRNKDKVVYCHVTCATDTNNVKAVFHAVKDIIIRRALGDAGLV